MSGWCYHKLCPRKFMPGKYAQKVYARGIWPSYTCPRDMPHSIMQGVNVRELYPRRMSENIVPEIYVKNDNARYICPRGRYQRDIHTNKRTMRIASEICPWIIRTYEFSEMDVNAFANILHVSCSYTREDALIRNVYR